MAIHSCAKFAAIIPLLCACLFTARAEEPAVWHIKAVHPDGQLLDVNAIDKDGKTHPLKALKIAGNGHLLDIKAMAGNEPLPVKILVSDDVFAPVKAIAGNGEILAVKA